MKQRWIEGILNAIADKGRDFLKTGPTMDLCNPRQLCVELASGRHGEASGIALARELLRSYQQMDEAGKLAFFRMLLNDFGVDALTIRRASDAYVAEASSANYLALTTAAEAKRQELLRRLNMAPEGTSALVRMRADLLGFVKKRPELKAVDVDFRHLLASWFNRGFLKIASINWDSSASLLDKLIAYEAVHKIDGFVDLRRRLAEDRRCFAFFHPAMPGEPLIFVEVALVKGISTSVQPLLDAQVPIERPEKADTAIFYSINNTQVGLRGVSFGNFLIKQVVEELKAELPHLRKFSTLSPLPRFVSTLRLALTGKESHLDSVVVEALLQMHTDLLARVAPAPTLAQSMLRILDGEVKPPHADIAMLIKQLALAYLLSRGPRGAIDPVTSFHLSNGALLHAINPFADVSEHGMSISYGVMVNYLYDLDAVEVNHENYVSTGRVTLSSKLARMEKRLVHAHSRRKRHQQPLRAESLGGG